MSVTIRDVAKLAGVSPSTVSRVASGSSRISKPTKEKVYAAMEKLGYYQNYHAHSLAAKQTNSIGLIMPHSTEHSFLHPFFPEVIRGISVRANEKGYNILLSTGGNNQQQIEDVMEMIKGRKVDGLISLYSRHDDPLLDFIKERMFPFVMIGKPAQDEGAIAYVNNDNVLVTRDLTRHLIELGHKHIGFVGGDLKFVVNEDRLSGFRQALEEAGIVVNPSFVTLPNALYDGGYDAIKKIMTLPHAPTALVVIDDVMAFGVLSALNELGIIIPDQLSVVGINDFLISQISSPPLTTMNIGIFDLGYQAMNKLLKWIQAGKPDLKPTIVKHKLIERNSTLSIL